MKKPTYFLSKLTLYLAALALLSFNLILLPELAREEAAGKPTPPVTYPFFLSAWAISTPIFIALYHLQKLLDHFYLRSTFSTRTLSHLRRVKQLSIITTTLILLFFAGLILYLRTAAPHEDAPPFFMLGGLLVFAALTTVTFLSILESLFRSAIKLKKENDKII